MLASLGGGDAAGQQAQRWGRRLERGWFHTCVQKVKRKTGRGAAPTLELEDTERERGEQWSLKKKRGLGKVPLNKR